MDWTRPFMAPPGKLTLYFGYLLFYLNYFAVSLLSGFITAFFIIDT